MVGEPGGFTLPRDVLGSDRVSLIEYRDGAAWLTLPSRATAHVSRAGSDPIARRVKLADLEDNMDLSRIPSPTARDHARIEKYQEAYRRLQEHP